MVLESLVPDSLNDGGAILFWVLLILLAILVIVDIRLYLKGRKESQNSEPQRQELNRKEDVETSQEERERSFVEIHLKVDQILETHKL